MTRLYASIISEDKAALVNVARTFSHVIEVTADGILFDVSGLERLVGRPPRIAQKISAALKQNGISGSIAVAETVETATFLARQNSGLDHKVHSLDTFQRLPLSDLPIERDTLSVFNELGLYRIEDVLAIPHDDLIARYGHNFRSVIDALEQKGTQLLTPNIKETQVSWKFDLDNSVEDFEQLIFVANHGLEKLFREVRHYGFSTEQLDLSFRLSNKTQRRYEIKTSFPSLERGFWLKLLNLRISLSPPEAPISGIEIVCHFTKSRPAQRGLYAVSRPEPESLLLTINKLKNLNGESNVGVPRLLNDRLAEPFTIDNTAMPEVDTEKVTDRSLSIEAENDAAQGTVCFTYFRPPVSAEVLIRNSNIVFVRSRLFAGHVINFSGVWKGTSHWWDKPWKTHEWDIEVENAGIYRLCKAGEEWFVTGEYD